MGKNDETGKKVKEAASGEALAGGKGGKIKSTTEFSETDIGKKRGKSKSIDKEASTLNVQKSIHEFIEKYASKQQLLEDDDDEWTWESYTVSEESLKDDAKAKKVRSKVEIEAEPEKYKKPKKGKKEEEVPEFIPQFVPTGDEIADEILRLRAIAEAEALIAAGVDLSPPEEEVDKKGKGKKGKKISPSELEHMRKIEEAAAKLAAEEDKKRLAKELKEGIEKEKRDNAEHQLRSEQLASTMQMINKIKKKNLRKAFKQKAQLEWEQYLKCDGLPDPYVCGQLNTYLHLWEQTLESTTIDDAAFRTAEALKLLDDLTALIDDHIGVKKSLVENWKWVRGIFREYQRRTLDVACYRLLTDIERNLVRIDLYTANFERKENDFAIFLYLRLKLPKRMPNPRKPPPPRVDLQIRSMQMNVLFPESITGKLKVFRVMYLRYDHLSDLCETYCDPPFPEQYNFDFYQSVLDEWYSKLLYKYQRREKPPKVKGEPEPPEEFVDKAAGIVPIVPFQTLEPSASTYVLFKENKIFLQTRKGLSKTVEDNVVNFRRSTVLGGIYCIDIFNQTPQPHAMFTYEISNQRLKLPKYLREAPINIEYIPPEPYTPEPTAKKVKNWEAEIEAENQRRKDAAFDRLLLVTVMLPSHVLWFKVPDICKWDKDKQVWMTDGIYNFQYLEEENIISFRTGTIGCFSFTTDRYYNLPFRTWDLKPCIDGTVLFQIKATVITIEFKIKNDTICVSKLENIPKSFKGMIGIYYKFPKLIRTLQEIGIDIFPAVDAFCYIEGTCEKHFPLETHAYFIMAYFSVCYSFTRSRWNEHLDRRSIVLQVKENKLERIKQSPFNTVLLTTENAMYVDCNEHSEEFPTEISITHPCADLYNLLKSNIALTTKNLLRSTPCDQVVTVAKLMKATRVLSIC